MHSDLYYHKCQCSIVHIHAIHSEICIYVHFNAMFVSVSKQLLRKMSNLNPALRQELMQQERNNSSASSSGGSLPSSYPDNPGAAMAALSNGRSQPILIQPVRLQGKNLVHLPPSIVHVRLFLFFIMFHLLVSYPDVRVKLHFWI